MFAPAQRSDAHQSSDGTKKSELAPIEQTAIANPHVTLHYLDPDGNLRVFGRSTNDLPVEPKALEHPFRLAHSSTFMLRPARWNTVAGSGLFPSQTQS